MAHSIFLFILFASMIAFSSGFVHSPMKYGALKSGLNHKLANPTSLRPSIRTTLSQPRRPAPLCDLLGLGPAEIAISLVVALVLFGPETLKSLSKDVGKAAAELKEIPKTFKEGMEEGAESSQVAKMKAMAAEKRKKREAKESKDDDDDDDDAPPVKSFEG